MKVDASVRLDAKYDHRFMEYECCKLLGIQLRMRRKSPGSQLDNQVFLVAKNVTTLGARGLCLALSSLSDYTPLMSVIFSPAARDLQNFSKDRIYINTTSRKKWTYQNKVFSILDTGIKTQNTAHLTPHNYSE